MRAEAWRLIETGPCEAFFNMALDEAIARCAMDKDGPPSLRIYRWKSPSVTLGRFQKASDINTEYCERNNIPIVRRPTGGRAILHAEELTYSFSAATGHGTFGRDLFSSYSAISRAFLLAFASLGLRVSARRQRHGRDGRGDRTRNPLCFASTSFGEITLEGKKIIGSAQRRWPGGMLQQGSIPLVVRKEDEAGVFGKTPGDAQGPMGLCEAIPGLTYESLRRAVKEGFEEALGISLVESQPSEREQRTAGILSEQKYKSHAWNHLR